MRRKLVVGNWKMNGTGAANAALLAELLSAQADWRCDTAVCAPFPYLGQVSELLDGSTVPGARRTVRRTSRAHSPARSRRRCWPSSAAAT